MNSAQIIDHLDILHDAWLDLTFSGCDHAFPACSPCKDAILAEKARLEYALEHPPKQSPFTRRAQAGLLPGKALSNEIAL